MSILRSQCAILFQQLIPIRKDPCLSGNKNHGLKTFYALLHFNDYGDNHHLRTRDKSPENIGSLNLIVTRVVSNCFRSSIVTFLACKVTCKIVFLCNVYKKLVGDQNL